MSSKKEIIENLPSHLVWWDSEREEGCMTDKGCEKAMDVFAEQQSIAFAEHIHKNYDAWFDGWCKHNDSSQTFTTSELYQLFIKQNQ